MEKIVDPGSAQIAPTGNKAQHQEESFSNKHTAFNTNAPTSNEESENDDVELETKPLDGYVFRGMDFPEADPLDLRITTNGEEVKLMSYRWPAEGDRKGVIFMYHGYGSCAAHISVFAKFYAADGYEVFAMDMRGFGNSEGERGFINSSDQLYSDCWALVFEACKKFKINAQRTPLYLWGRSFGGLLVTNMANTVVGRSMISGVILLTPYYRLYTELLYESYKYLVPLTYFRPNHIF